ncbi:MAG: permease-like cell division protein FtsX [Patescibacteria group bacterium]
MFWTNVNRICKSGFINFWRNGFVSLSSVLVMIITMLVVGLMIFGSAVFSSSLEQLKQKVDINVYFVTSAPEEGVLALKKDIEALVEVKSVEYLSREQVLEEFKDRHQNDQLTIQALEELGENPLGATLNIRAKETSQYESIAKFLESKSSDTTGYASLISKVNYYDNKTSIDALNKIIISSTRAGTLIVSIFIVISILITFVMIQLVIYTARDEISVMRLVGASLMYIRGPFMVTGVMSGIVAAIIALIILYGLAWWLAPSSSIFFGGLNLASYFVNNFAEIFGIIMGSSIVLGILGSYLAVRRYLTI